MKIKIALISFLGNSINTRLLSACLKEQGYDVTCCFCPGDFTQQNIDALLRLLREKSVSLVGVSLVTDDYARAVQLTREIKNQLALPVIWGGAHVNVKPEESLRHADMICMGEGEDALLELADSISATGSPDTTVRNIWFRTDNGIIRNELRDLEENLNRYPFPDFDLSSQYIMTGDGLEAMNPLHLNGEYSIMTSRGCPYKCRYCYNSYRWEQYRGKGKYLRTRSIANVIAELEKAMEIFGGLREINFWDDSFVARKAEDFEVFRQLYPTRIQLPFFALIEPMAYDANKIAILKECGLASLQVGIQSGSERVNREVYNRPVSNERILAVANSIHDLKISVIYDLIFNTPYETRQDMEETVKLLLQLPKPFKVQGYNLIFYPGTAITDSALRDGFITHKDDAEDFTTIQGKGNSPTATGETEVSSRFYRINYRTDDRRYLTQVISLMALNRVPTAVIRYFAASETAFKRVQLALFQRLYTALSRFKNTILNNG